MLVKLDVAQHARGRVQAVGHAPLGLVGLVRLGHGRVVLKAERRAQAAQHPFRIAHQLLETHLVLPSRGISARKAAMFSSLTTQISSANWRREKPCSYRKKIWSSRASPNDCTIPSGWRNRWM